MAQSGKKSEEKDRIRKIWLAGIGAYGRAFSEAKGAVDSLSGKSSEVFEELVQKGEMLEMVGKYKAEELLGKGKAAAKDMTPDFDIDDRIARMRARLSGSGGGEGGDARLAARVDQLEAKLDAILEHLNIGDAPKAKPSAKKPTSKRKAAPAKAKPASKKRIMTERTAPQKTASKKTAPAKKAPTKKTSAKPKSSPKS